MDEIRTARFRRSMWSWFMFVLLPLGMLFRAVWLALGRDLDSQIVIRQFINCYVAVPVFLFIVAITLVLCAVSVRLGASPLRVIEGNLPVMTMYVALLVLLGLLFLASPAVTHDCYAWPLGRQMRIAATNLVTVIVPSAMYLGLSQPQAGLATSGMARVVSCLTFLLWGYLVSSACRMLSPFVLIE